MSKMLLKEKNLLSKLEKNSSNLFCTTSTNLYTIYIHTMLLINIEDEFTYFRDTDFIRFTNELGTIKIKHIILH